MAFDVLSAEGEDARRWTALVNNLPAQRRDIHFLPEYGRIYRDSYGFSPHLAVYRAGEDFIIQPLVRRPLRKLPFLADAADAGSFSDVANPYGYGGPVSNVSGHETAHHLYKRFAEAFARWCDDADIASEFASLHPFMAQHQLAIVSPVLAPKLEKNIVFVDLAQSEAATKKDIRKGHRSSIAAARRAGARIEKVEATANNLALFNEMYDATMVRQNAADRWFVPKNYFETCMRQLGAGRSSLFFAFLDHNVESGCLLMHDFATAYYHFAGTYAKHPALGVNNLMVYETAIWARSAGYTRFHLGGGVTGNNDDSLLRFKSGFSDLRAPLYTYFCIRDKAVYDRLCERKRAYELATTGAESQSDFVPIYRR
jgi:Acetyltransferase (GNAT) domain